MTTALTALWAIIAYPVGAAIVIGAVVLIVLIVCYALFDDHHPLPSARDILNVPDSAYADTGHHGGRIGRGGGGARGGGGHDGAGDDGIPVLRVLSWNTWCIPVYGTGNPTDGPAPGLWARLTRPFGRAGFLTRILAPPLLDKKPHGRAVAAFLQRRIREMSRAPDVLLLQEVWGAPTANAWQEACLSRKAVIEALRGDYPFYTGSRGCGTNPYAPLLGIPPLDSGLLIMSKHPIREADVHFERFASVRGNECFVGKGVLAARIAVPLEGREQEVLFATTHLQANLNLGDDNIDVQLSQTRQIGALLRRLRQQDDAPVVIAGDFNPASTQALERMEAALDEALGGDAAGGFGVAFEPGSTTTTNERPHSGFPQAQLDAAFATGLQFVRATVKEDRPNRVDRENPSDHKPLLVDLAARGVPD